MIIYYSIMSQFGAKVMKTPGIMSTLTTTCGNNTLRGGQKLMIVFE